MNVIEKHKRGLQEEHRQQLRDNLEVVMNFFPDDLGAVSIVAFGLDGCFSRVTRISKDCPIGQTLLPAATAEVLRRDVSREVSLETLEH